MSEKYPFIPSHLVKVLEDVSIPLIDLIHGHLKVAMLYAEAELVEKQQIEIDNDYGDALDSMERKYWEGYSDALTELYALTYNISIDRKRIEEAYA